MQSKTRLTLFALTALVILVLAVAATPSARTFAQTVWQKVGPLIIVNELAPTPDVSSEAATPIPGQGFAEYPDPRPSQGSERAAAIDVKASPTPVPFDASLKHLTDQQAHDLYGFQVLQPAYMPNGYQLATHQINRFANGKIVSGLVYLTKSTAFDAPYLGIEQSTYQEQPPYEFMVGDATISQVTVRGITATFIEGAPLMTVRGDTGQNVTLLVDYLMWEENGSFFVINATQLTQQEMIQIAESLQ